MTVMSRVIFRGVYRRGMQRPFEGYLDLEGVIKKRDEKFLIE